jgi:SAM-dependent methyltransferase
MPERLLSNWLQHPLTRGMDLDHPDTTMLRKEIIRQKPFLRRLYSEWYRLLASQFPAGAQVLELGSGAGFLEEFIPGLITTDILPLPGVSQVMDACAMPLKDGSLDGIVMTNVLHHIPDVETFFDEAVRTLRPGGRIAMIEPWNNGWSRRIYHRLHHEPFEPNASSWKLRGSGPLSDANGALPWILFARDNEKFKLRFPGLQIKQATPIMPFTYLLSGGVSMRNLLPGIAYPVLRSIEKMLPENRIGMFAFILLEKA